MNSKDNLPLISIIIPVYNVEQYLDKCLESVCNQTYSNLEIIVINDGSTDSCSDICRIWKEKDSRIILIEKENGGLSDARNAGLKKATGQYIGFVDSDDYIEKDMYEKMLGSIQQYNSDICVCATNVYYKGKIVRVNSCCKLQVSNSYDALVMLFNNLVSIPTWNKLYKSSLWKNVQFPKGKIYEDEYTIPYIIEKSHLVSYMETPFYNYIERENSILRTKISIRTLDRIYSVEEQVKRLTGKTQELDFLLHNKYYNTSLDVFMLSLEAGDNALSKEAYRHLRKALKLCINKRNFYHKRVFPIITGYYVTKNYYSLVMKLRG